MSYGITINLYEGLKTFARREVALSRTRFCDESHIQRVGWVELERHSVGLDSAWHSHKSVGGCGICGCCHRHIALVGNSEIDRFSRAVGSLVACHQNLIARAIRGDGDSLGGACGVGLVSLANSLKR